MKVKENGVNKLTEQQEAMRMNVVDLELKARYWKAQYEIRHYTLENDKLQSDYNAYLETTMAEQEAMIKRYTEEVGRAADGQAAQPVDEAEPQVNVEANV